jgi:hypothetical protein
MNARTWTAAVLLAGAALVSQSVAADSVLTLPAQLTGQQLSALVSGIVQDLQNAGVTLVGESGIQVNGVAGYLNTDMQALNKMLAGRVDQPLATLGADVQSAATQVYVAVTHLQDLISRQRQCLQLNEQLFVSGVRTIGANLKSGVPLVKQDAPFVSDFTFDNVATPFVTPRDGGRLTVTGFALWQDYPPIVTLQDEARSRTIATLQPSRAASNDAFSAVLDKNIVENNAGACLDMKIVATQENKLGIIPLGTKTTELHLPMCITRDYDTSFSMTAWVSADETSDVDLGVLPPKVVYYSNDSCENRHSVSDARAAVWTNLPADDYIDSIDKKAGQFMVNESNVSLNVTGSNVVSAAGWLDTATCQNFGFTRRRVHSTIYQMIVTPHYAGPKTTTDQASNSIGPTNAVIPQTQMCINVPKKEKTPTTTWWFAMDLLDRKLPPPPVGSPPNFYISPRMTAGQSDASLPTAHVGGYTIDSHLSPTPVNGNAQVCTTVTVPDQCRY